jgi:riboflavin biosynthesis pyrimidine reductase
MSVILPCRAAWRRATAQAILADMRLLVPGSTGLTPGKVLTRADLVRAYTTDEPRWVRCNMVSTLDGAANGPDGRSGTINTDADHVVFDLLRALSDVVVVGAGTVRVEGYPALDVPRQWQELRDDLGLDATLPLVVVTGTGDVPPTVRDAAPGRVLLATTASALGLEEARGALGRDHVLVCGSETVDLDRLLDQLRERALQRVLVEGGPQLTGSFLAADALDELCFTISPLVVGAGHPRPVEAQTAPHELTLGLLLEQDGTLLGRWFTRR